MPNLLLAVRGLDNKTFQPARACLREQLTQRAQKQKNYPPNSYSFFQHTSCLPRTVVKPCPFWSSSKQSCGHPSHKALRSTLWTLHKARRRTAGGEADGKERNRRWSDGARSGGPSTDACRNRQRKHPALCRRGQCEVSNRRCLLKRTTAALWSHHSMFRLGIWARHDSICIDLL